MPLSIRLYLAEYVHKTDVHLFSTWTSSTLQKLINFSFTPGTKSPISITIKHQFSYTTHKLSMHPPYPLRIMKHSSWLFPLLVLTEGLSFSISSSGFTLKRWEFNRSIFASPFLHKRLPQIWPQRDSQQTLTPCGQTRHFCITKECLIFIIKQLECHLQL